MLTGPQLTSEDFDPSVHFNSSTWNPLCYLLTLLLSKKITVINVKLNCSSEQSIHYFRDSHGSTSSGFSFFPIPFLSKQNSHKINRKKKKRKRTEQKARRDQRRCRKGKWLCSPCATFLLVFPLSLPFFFFKNASAASCHAGETAGSFLRYFGWKFL